MSLCTSGPVAVVMNKGAGHAGCRARQKSKDNPGQRHDHLCPQQRGAQGTFGVSVILVWAERSLRDTSDSIVLDSESSISPSSFFKSAVSLSARLKTLQEILQQ